MNFALTFTITNRMIQAIALIKSARAVTPLSSFASSRLHMQRRGIQG